MNTMRSGWACSMLLSAPLHALPATTPPIPSIPMSDVAIRIPAPLGLPNPARFGIAVAMDEDRLFIGCDGRRDGIPLEGQVLVYEPDSIGSWTWTGTLTPPESEIGDEFGGVLALDGNHLVIGAPGSDGHRGGAWYVDLDALGDPLQSMKRIPIPDPLPGDRFGESIAIHANTIAIGAPRADVGGFPDRGRVVTATITPHGPRPLGEPIPGRPGTGLRFGWSVAIGTMLHIGAPGADAPDPRGDHRIDRAGAVIGFELDAPHRRLGPRHRPQAMRLERFGTCLSTVGEDVVLVGSPRAMLDDVRCGTVSLLLEDRTAEIGAAFQPDSNLGEPLVSDDSIFATGMPGRRDLMGRANPCVRLGRLLPDRPVPTVDLLLDDRERTFISLSLSASGGRIAIGSPDPAIDDGPVVPGEVHLIRLDPILRRSR